MRPVRIGFVAAVLALAGCGDGDSSPRIEETALRDCLAEAGFKVSAAEPSATAGLASVTPDLRAEAKGGLVLDVVIERTPERARRTAADLRSALQSYGVTDLASVLVERENAVLVFAETPSAPQRDAVESCLG
jgi:hypothetical protein